MERIKEGAYQRGSALKLECIGKGAHWSGSVLNRNQEKVSFLRARALFFDRVNLF